VKTSSILKKVSCRQAALWEGEPYKSVSDVLKFLSLGGGVGALANLTDEELDF
jgi:hypothetical protein